MLRCIICHRLILVSCDATKVTVMQFIEDGLKGQLKLDPFSVATDSGFIIYEAEQDDEAISTASSSKVDTQTIAQLQLEEQPLSVLDDSGVNYRAWIKHQCDVALTTELIFRE